MERISLQSDRKAIIAEHVHRYKLCSEIAKGNVLDISCGIGYGSKILTENKEVLSYQGIDISSKDIDYAKENFKASNVEFSLGDITALSFPDNTFDSIISLETLEHLTQPALAIKEISRVLKDDGIFIGSVPEDTYDRKCAEVYGPNPYHLITFSEAEMRKLLEQKFKCIEILRVGVAFGTIVSGIRTDAATIEKKIEGSLFFVASKTDRNLHSIIEKIQGKFIPALSMLDYDIELEIPLRQTIKDQSNLIEEKDEVIKNQDLLIQDRDTCIASMNQMIKEKDELIASMERLIDRRWEIIQEYENTLKSLRGDKD